jgi:hypothetical protein
VQEQLQLDAHNYDDLREHIASSNVPLTPRQQQIWRELRQKHQVAGEVVTALKSQETPVDLPPATR